MCIYIYIYMHICKPIGVPAALWYTRRDSASIIGVSNVWALRPGGRSSGSYSKTVFFPLLCNKPLELGRRVRTHWCKDTSNPGPSLLKPGAHDHIRPHIPWIERPRKPQRPQKNSRKSKRPQKTSWKPKRQTNFSGTSKRTHKSSRK